MLKRLLEALPAPVQNDSVFLKNFGLFDNNPPKILSLLLGLEILFKEEVKYLSYSPVQGNEKCEAVATVNGLPYAARFTNGATRRWEFEGETNQMIGGIPMVIGEPDSLVVPILMRLAYAINSGVPKVKGAGIPFFAGKVVESYETLIDTLKGINELPLRGTSPDAAKIKSGADLPNQAKLTSALDECLSGLINLCEEFGAEGSTEMVKLIDAVKVDPSMNDVKVITSWIKPAPQQPQPSPAKTRTKKLRLPETPWFMKDDQPFYIAETVFLGYATQYNGGVPGMLLVGEPGTKKTTNIKLIADKLNIPLTKVSFAPETPRDAILGNTRVKIENGQITPVAVLGALTEPFRQSMLLATLLTIRKHKSEASKIVEDFPNTKTKRLWLMAIKHINNRRAWKLIERMCQPTNSEEWKWTDKLYHELYVPERGGICHMLFIDELHHLVGNPAILYLLQNAMEDERKLIPSEAGFDCHALYGYNLRIVAAGNPTGQHGIPPALKSRFPFISYVGAQTVDKEKADLRTALKRNIERSKGKTFLKPQLSLEDVFHPSYTGIKNDIDMSKAADLPAAFENKLFAFADYVKDQYRKGKTKSFLDKRSIFAMACYAQYLFSLGLTPNKVAERVVNPILAEMVGYRSDGSISNESDFNTFKSSFEQRLTI
jgi:MoxR-like ATPase